MTCSELLEGSDEKLKNKLEECAQPSCKDNKTCKKLYTMKKVCEALFNSSYVTALGKFADALPEPEEVSQRVKELFGTVDVALVEDLGYKRIFISRPGFKGQDDFIVVSYDVIESRVKIPSHDDLARSFEELWKADPSEAEKTLDALVYMVRDRLGDERASKRAGLTIPSRGVDELIKTFKWIALQEDANYPPPENLGGVMALMYIASANFLLERDLLRRVRARNSSVTSVLRKLFKF